VTTDDVRYGMSAAAVELAWARYLLVVDHDQLEWAYSHDFEGPELHGALQDCCHT